MLAPDLLPPETGLAPHTRILQGMHEILVHEPGDIFHLLPTTQREWPVLLGGLAWRFGVHPNDAKPPEQPGPDLAETASGDCRYCHGGIAQAGQLAEYLQFSIHVGNQVRLGRQHEYRQLERERILLALIRFSDRAFRAWP